MDKGFDGGNVVGLVGHEDSKLVDISRDGMNMYVEDTSEKPFKPSVRGTN